VVISQFIGDNDINLSGSGHMNATVDIDKLHKCEHCSYSSKEDTSLKAHSRTHIGETKFRCDKCGYSAKNRKTLDNHKRKRKEDKPCPCTPFDFEAKESSRLKSHFRIHTGEKPYKCDIYL